MSAGSRTLPTGVSKQGDDLVFREPWEAEVFALAVRLQEQGLFTWDEWAQALGEAIARAQAAGDPDDGDTYYLHWTRALEHILTRTATLDSAAIDRRTDRWRRAYLATPHGHPVDLCAVDE